MCLRTALHEKKLRECFMILKKQNKTVAPFEHNETPQSTLEIHNKTQNINLGSY